MKEKIVLSVLMLSLGISGCTNVNHRAMPVSEAQAAGVITTEDVFAETDETAQHQVATESQNLLTQNKNTQPKEEADPAALERGKALFQQASLMLKSKDSSQYPKAFALMQEAAQTGYVEAEYGLGYLYRTATGTPNRDFTQSTYWFTKAANKDYAKAQTSLGMRYLLGEGTQEAPAKAAEWFEKAAKQGDLYGQNALATLYAEGRGVEQNFPEAVKWFTLAASQGLASAQYQLGLIYSKGLGGVQPDNTKAIYWLQKALAQQYKPAEALLKQVSPTISTTESTKAQ